MKIYRTILSVVCVASVALGTSCHGELDITQSDKLNTTNMWTTESDALTATTGIYYRLRQAFAQSKANPFFWGELRVGPAMWGKGTDRSLCDNDMLNVMLNTLSASDASTNWSYLYTTIDQCNQVLKYAPGIGMSEENMHYCLGNAHFIRAYCYFWIARVWGDAPVITAPTEGTGEAIYPTRHPVAELYTLIGNDLNAAAGYIKTNAGGCYFATADNVNLLRADFALWMYAAADGGESYLTMAQTALDAVQSAALVDRFADVFSITNKKNKEIAFALHLENGEYTSGSYYAYFIWGSTQIKAEYRNSADGVPVNSNQWFLYSDDFIDFLKQSRAQGDQRTDVTYMERTGVSDMYSVIQWPNKFIGNISTGTMVWEQDFILYRYAQYYTMLSELHYHRKNYPAALSTLNTLAQRAYGRANFYTDSSAAAVRQALVDENLKEFAEEGNVYFTLIRLGAIHDYNPYRYVDGLGQCGIDTSRPNQLLMPVSKSAMNKNNKITQTQGWS